MLARQERQKRQAGPGSSGHFQAPQVTVTGGLSGPEKPKKSVALWLVL